MTDQDTMVGPTARCAHLPVPAVERYPRSCRSEMRPALDGGGSGHRIGPTAVANGEVPGV